MTTAASTAQTLAVTADNFKRAESDQYFGNLVNDGAFGRFHHERLPAAIDNQKVVRLNRDTLYSSGIFDLDAGPVTVTLPDAGTRFRSMMVLNQDHYVQDVVYGAGAHSYTREGIGTRYVLLALRTLVNPADSRDLEQVHALQDAVTVAPRSPGSFEVPVDGFWSVSVYNADGYFEANPLDAYSLNNLTARRDADGAITIQFGGCDGKVANCLPVMKGWNYTVRLYRPRAEILSGAWTFPEATPVG